MDQKAAEVQRTKYLVSNVSYFGHMVVFEYFKHLIADVHHQAGNKH